MQNMSDYIAVSRNILMLLLALYCTHCRSSPFCILCTRPKSCFGGVNEQSGYLVCRRGISQDVGQIYCDYEPHSLNYEDDPQLSCWLPKPAGFSRRLLVIDHKVVENCLPQPGNKQNVVSPPNWISLEYVFWVCLLHSWFSRCHRLPDELLASLRHLQEIYSVPMFSDF